MKVKFAPFTKIGKKVKAQGVRFIEDGVEMYRGVSIVSKGGMNSLWMEELKKKPLRNCPQEL